MANVTTEINVTKADWVKVCAVGEQAVITPDTKDISFYVRYSVLKPALTDKGHVFNVRQNNPRNATVGSANLEGCWIKLVAGNPVSMSVSVV